MPKAEQWEPVFTGFGIRRRGDAMVGQAMGRVKGRVKTSGKSQPCLHPPSPRLRRTGRHGYECNVEHRARKGLGAGQLREPAGWKTCCATGRILRCGDVSSAASSYDGQAGGQAGRGMGLGRIGQMGRMGRMSGRFSAVLGAGM
jgi:hypothetical protein